MTTASPLRRAVVATALLFAAITVLGLPLRTDVAPLGVVSLQLAPTVDAAAAVLTSWADVPRPWLLVAHGLDVLLPLAYAGTIVLAARRHGSRSAARLAVAAALADQVENLLMLRTILDGPTTTLVGVTLLAATVKWTALVIALVLLARAVVATRRSAVSA